MDRNSPDVAKRPVGRPVKWPMPDPIPDTPENILKAVLNSPPRDKDDWDYLKQAGADG